MSIQLTVHDLTLQYESHPILDRLQFEISRGQRVALLGANGAGKTTLLRCISKALKPTAGAILLEKRDLESLSPRELAQTMAVVPQETRTDFDFTVEETVLMGRLPYLKRFTPEGDDEKSIARRAMAMTGVSHLAKRSIATLSGGEKQRVIIARALCQEPQILLLDEPTANLDLGYQHSLLELITGLNREKGITIIAAIHDLNLAARFFDRMLLLSSGRVLAAGTAEEVIAPGPIKTAYGVDALIYRHPLAGCLQVSVRNNTDDTKTKQPPIHLIGGRRSFAGYGIPAPAGLPALDRPGDTRRQQLPFRCFLQFTSNRGAAVFPGLRPGSPGTPGADKKSCSHRSAAYPLRDRKPAQPGSGRDRPGTGQPGCHSQPCLRPGLGFYRR